MVGNCWFVLIKKAFRFWAVFITYSQIIQNLVFELKLWVPKMCRHALQRPRHAWQRPRPTSACFARS